MLEGTSRKGIEVKAGMDLREILWKVYFLGKRTGQANDLEAQRALGRQAETLINQALDTPFKQFVRRSNRLK